ncbi:MAG: IS200/IS605 family transposase [Deltaproteobacteria bacterium]|nr:IS200/IS605 family transposase [Deltaproteobacteria bacterium]
MATENHNYLKYRYHILVKEIKPRLREILMELCEWLDITVIEGAICQDHVHMYLSVPPKHSPAFVMNMLKGKSEEYLCKELPELGKKYWGLGTRIFRQYRGHQQHRDTELCERASRGANSRRTAYAME